MRTRVNGVEKDLPEGMTVAQLLREFGAGRPGLAVAVNERVVRRSLHDATVLGDGDCVEIIQAVAGG